MKPKRSDLVTPKSGQAECNICKKFLCNRLDNIRRHYQTRHLAEYERIGGATRMVKTPLTTKEMYIDNIVEIHCTGNCAFRFWNMPAMQRNQACFSTEFGVACSASSMSRLVKGFAANVRVRITEEVRLRYLCLKFDIATRRHRSILGISVQYLSADWRIQIRYLTMTTITGSTADNLRRILEECLEEYGVDKRYVFASTTDNGANVLKCSRELMEGMQWMMTLESITEAREAIDLFDDEEDGDDTFDQIDFETVDTHEVRNVRNLAAEFGSLETRCAAHVIQLAVHDLMAPEHRRIFITSLKDKVKHVRKYIRTLPNDGRPKMPLLANETRWSSTFYMVCK